MLVTMWILTGVFGIIGAALLRKFLIDRINGMEAVIFIISVIIFAFAAGMLYDGVTPFGAIIDVGQ